MQQNRYEILLDIVEGARDRTAFSDELHAAVSDPTDRDHVGRTRPAFLLPFSLHRGMRVLEVGAGSGAVTRYLGERCGRVDALERDRRTARVAVARTRDLPSVTVRVGGIRRIPPRPVYHLAVVADGAAGRRGASPTDPRFWPDLVRRLRPDGAVIWAVANAKGVKRLARSPDREPAVSRARAETLARGAGLHPVVHHAFPDHVHTRAVFRDELLTAVPAVRSLAWRIPHFPSPDRGGPAPRERDERETWRDLLERGLGPKTANSFIVVASPAPGGSELWPGDALASFFTAHRRAIFATMSWVRSRPGGTRFERQRIADGRRRLEHGEFILEPRDEPFVRGEDLVDVLVRDGEQPGRRWLGRWRDAHRRAVARPPRLSDAGPRNTVAAPDGSLHFIDQEWRHRGYTEDDLLRRHMFWAANIVSGRSPRSRRAERTRDLAAAMGRWVGLDPRGAWLEETIERESRHQALIHECDPGSAGWDVALRRYREAIRAILDRRL